jgi:hypothetical protein
MVLPTRHQTFPLVVLAASQTGTELAPEPQRQTAPQRQMVLVLQKLTALELRRVHRRRELEQVHRKHCPNRMLMLAREHQNLQIPKKREGMLQIQLAHWWTQKVHRSVPAQGRQRVRHSGPEPVLQRGFDWKELRILLWVPEQEFQRHRILPRKVPTVWVPMVALRSHQRWVVVAVAAHQILQRKEALSFQRVLRVRAIQRAPRKPMPQTACCSIVQTSILTRF